MATSSIISATITGHSGSSLTRKLSTASDNSLSSSVDDGDDYNDYGRTKKKTGTGKHPRDKTRRPGGGSYQHHQHHRQQQSDPYSPGSSNNGGNNSPQAGTDTNYDYDPEIGGGEDGAFSPTPSSIYQTGEEELIHAASSDDNDDHIIRQLSNKDNTNSSRKSFLADPYELLIRQAAATMNPLLANHVEKVKVRVRIVYANSQTKTEVKDFTPQELLLDILAFEKKADRGASATAILPNTQRKSFTATMAPPSGNKPPLSTVPSAGIASPPISSPSSSSRPLTVQDPRAMHSNGNGSNAFDQRDFIASITQRDLRRYTTRVNSTNEPAPYIIVRRHCVILALGAVVRAIIQHNRIIFITQNDGHIGSQIGSKDSRFLDLVEKNVKQAYHNIRHSDTDTNTDSDGSMGFEVTSYESLLNIVASLLKQQYDTCNQATSDLVREIGNNALLSVSLQDKMRILKDQVRELYNRCNVYCQLLNDILQSTEYNDDFAYLYLTELYRDPFLYNIPVQEGSRILYSRSCAIETIMDSLLMDFEELERSSHNLVKQLSATETSVALRLEASRNELLVATTIISIISSTIGFAGFITGAFGMNLDNTQKFETINGFFAWVITLCVLFIITASAGVILYFEKSGWLPKHDYWENFKQLQNKATTLVPLNTILEGVTSVGAGVVNSVNNVAGNSSAFGSTGPQTPGKGLQQRKKGPSSGTKVGGVKANPSGSAKSKPSSSIKHQRVPTNDDHIEMIA